MSNAQSATHLEPLSFLWWPERQQQFEFLLHLLSYSDLSISVEGAEGSGKTEVVKRALNRMGQDLGWVAWIDARELQQPLDSQFEQLSESRTKAIHMLVIDNADALDIGDWQQVESWLTAGVPRLLLTTRKHQTLDRLDTRLHQIELSPLPKEQARSCWGKVYGDQIPVPATVWPGDLTHPTINPNQQRRTFILPKGHMIALGCIIISLSTAAYFQYQLEQTDRQISQASSKPSLAEPDPLDKLLQQKQPSEESVLNLSQSTSLQTESSQNESLQTQGSQKEGLQQDASKTVDPKTTDPKSDPSSQPGSQLNSQSTLNERASDDKSPSDALDQWISKQSVTVPQAVRSKTIPSTSKQQVNQSTGELSKQGIKVDTSSAGIAELDNRQSFDLTKEKKAHPLLALDGSHYVFQMLGTRNKKSALAFVNQYQGLTKSWWIYPDMFKGKPWFVVVYGPFDTRQQAMKAQRTFPKKLLAQKPWLRALKSVQQEIAKD
jgi:septal ring-binding cell division protein DamX